MSQTPKSPGNGSPYDDYFASGRDDYTLVRAKRAWVPEWLWWIAAHADRHGEWLAYWLSEVPRG